MYSMAVVFCMCGIKSIVVVYSVLLVRDCGLVGKLLLRERMMRFGGSGEVSGGSTRSIWSVKGISVRGMMTIRGYVGCEKDKPPESEKMWENFILIKQKLVNTR